MKLKYGVAIACCIGLFCYFTPAHGAEEAKTLKESLRSLASEIVITGKDAISGLNEGVEQGLGQEADANTKVVKNQAEFSKLLDANVIRVKALGDNVYELTLAVNNSNSFPVRISGLWELENVVLVDKDGFSYQPVKDPDQALSVTCLSKSLTRLRFRFRDVEAEPATLRFYQLALMVPKAGSGE